MLCFTIVEQGRLYSTAVSSQARCVLFLFTAVGCALGAMLRFLIMSRISVGSKQGFPLGLFLVNVVGSFCLGIFMALAQELPDSIWAGPWMQAFLTIGFCGGLTTFSTFSLETLKLVSSRSTKLLAIQILGSVGCCLLAVWIGYMLIGKGAL